jgi:hypothetical protein
VVPKSSSEITRDILSAWDDEAEETHAPPVETPQETTVETPVEEEEEEVDVGGGDVPTPAPSEPEEEPQEEQGEEEEEQEEGGEPPDEEEVLSGDPEVAAFLSKYGGDTEKALKGAADLSRLLSRQGQEKNQALQRAAELEAALAQMQAQTAMPTQQILSGEQREWVEQAIESGNTTDYVQAAVQAGEFGLARAVCDASAESEPYTASRLVQYVDQAEQYAAMVWQQQAQAQMGPAQVDRPTLMNVLVEHFPEMPQYEGQMVSTLQTLGDMHPLVQDSRSDDPETAARGIIGVYEIARATAAQVASTRSKVQQRKRAEAEQARGAAVVSSAKATPASSTEPSRTVQIAPGLTLDQLDAAWNE